MGSNKERWNWEEIDKVKGLPWQPTPGVAGYEIPTTAIMPDKGEKPGEGAKVRERKEAKYKGLYIYPTDLDNFGYTDGCKGCERVEEGINSNGRSRKHDE